MKNIIFSLSLMLLIWEILSSPQCCSAAPLQRFPLHTPAALQAPIYVQATILDYQNKPIYGAAFVVYDAAHRQLDDPDQVARGSGFDGKVSYHIRRSASYYIQAFAEAYLPSNTIKAVPNSDIISVTFHLKHSPIPHYLLTTVRATILDAKRHPIAVAFFDVSYTSKRNTNNFLATNAPVSDDYGHAEKTVRAGGVLHVRVQAYGYNPAEKIIRAKPGIISLTFILRRNGQPLSAIVDVSH